MAQPQQRFGKSTGSSGTSRAAADSPYTLNAWWRRGISLLVVAHLIIVFAVPLSIRPGSRLAAAITDWTRPWIDVAQPSFGYGYFAPNPGPSHLVAYGFWKQGQKEPKTQLIPNVKKQWPRLRYHRHFMLAEKLMGIYEPRVETEAEEIPSAAAPTSKWQGEMDKAVRQERAEDYEIRKRRRAMYEALAKSYAQHILADIDADEVELWLKRHVFPGPEGVTAGLSLEEEESYINIDESVVNVRKPVESSSTRPNNPVPEEVPQPVPKERPPAIPGGALR